MTFNNEYPIILGLAGVAGSGKSVTANAIAPISRVTNFEDEVIDPHGKSLYKSSSTVWTKLYFSMPIYRIVDAKQKIQGIDAFDRQLYEIHAILLDLFKGYITYEDLVETVYELVSMPLPSAGKPRHFLQYVGTEILRKFDDDCFIKWMGRQIREEWRFHCQEEDKKPDTIREGTEFKYVERKHLGIAIDDTRFKNECQFVRNSPNGILIKLTVDPEVAADRLEIRDGARPTVESKNHISEQQLNEIPDDWFNAIIDTTDVTIKEQVQIVKQVIGEALA